jgi:hypothetical protein
MQFDFASSKNGVKCKRLRENENKKKLNWCKQCEVSWVVSHCLCS